MAYLSQHHHQPNLAGSLGNKIMSVLPIKDINLYNHGLSIATRGQSSNAPTAVAIWAGFLRQTIVTCSQPAFGAYAEDLSSHD